MADTKRIPSTAEVKAVIDGHINEFLTNNGPDTEAEDVALAQWYNRTLAEQKRDGGAA